MKNAELDDAQTSFSHMSLRPISCSLSQIIITSVMVISLLINNANYDIKINAIISFVRNFARIIDEKKPKQMLQASVVLVHVIVLICFQSIFGILLVSLSMILSSTISITQAWRNWNLFTTNIEGNLL